MCYHKSKAQKFDDLTNQYYFASFQNITEELEPNREVGCPFFTLTELTLSEKKS